MAEQGATHHDSNGRGSDDSFGFGIPAKTYPSDLRTTVIVVVPAGRDRESNGGGSVMNMPSVTEAVRR
ncbi:hypothetical protein NDR87_00060 [Nocardia sp. CDC159]|uniref:Uncharacterized protein n=1 Tax=Nocardia pulmonis TaxID=2951408 RepID=A0A9X2IU79_9NOCA|nr:MULTISPECIES: hypothetical protein [Nocardia]MCM6772597.1 hypothetical protein [Nocardia pulmonis]MCM6784745.1 hypothetical protein [Nocardia sp. CDC159]